MASHVKRALEMEHKMAAAIEAEEEGDAETADTLREEALVIEVRVYGVRIYGIGLKKKRFKNREEGVRISGDCIRGVG
jgi:hypothetical protein